MRDQIKAALVEYLANLLRVEALQLIEIDCLQQIELLFCQLSQVILARQLLKKNQNLAC